MKRYIIIIALVTILVGGLVMAFGNNENGPTSNALAFFSFDSNDSSVNYSNESEEDLIGEISRAEIIPLEKVIINDISLSFGMKKSEVEKLIGEGDAFGDFYDYFDEIHIYYDELNRLEFIEFVGGIDGKIQPEIYGVSTFQTKADKLANILIEKNASEVEGSIDGYDMSFIELSVGVYRESTPEDAASMIEESKNDPDSEIDPEEELRKANYWNTIGAGAEGYYN